MPHSSYKNLPTHFHQHHNDDFSLYAGSHEAIFNGMKKKSLVSNIFLNKMPQKNCHPGEEATKMRMNICVCIEHSENLLFHCGNEKWWGEIYSDV